MEKPAQGLKIKMVKLQEILTKIKNLNVLTFQVKIKQILMIKLNQWSGIPMSIRMIWVIHKILGETLIPMMEEVISKHLPHMKLPSLTSELY